MGLTEGATAAGGRSCSTAARRPGHRRVGPYEIEHIDVDALVERFFFDTDFLMGATLLSAEESAPGQLRVTRQAGRIAAGLRPEAQDLRLTAVAGSGDPGSGRRIPASGYVGSYSLRERAEGGNEDER